MLKSLFARPIALSYHIQPARTVLGCQSIISSTTSIASTTTATAIAPGGSRFFHSTPQPLVRQKYLRRLKRLRKHYASQMLKPKEEKTDPVLGRSSVAFLERVQARVSEPYNQIDCLDSANTSKLLFGAEQAALQSPIVTDSDRVVITASETHKRDALLRIISMQNAKPNQAKKLAIDYAVKEFGRKEGDTGSSEVQAAVWTIKINYLANHLKENKQDLKGMRQLEEMVHQRQGILKYLKRTNPERYFWAIEKLGLSDDAVTTEFHMSRRYLWDVQFFGDKTLPLKKTKKETRIERKNQRMEKKARRFLAASAGAA